MLDIFDPADHRAGPEVIRLQMCLTPSVENSARWLTSSTCGFPQPSHVMDPSL